MNRAASKIGAVAIAAILGAGLILLVVMPLVDAVQGNPEIMALRRSIAAYRQIAANAKAEQTLESNAPPSQPAVNGRYGQTTDELASEQVQTRLKELADKSAATLVHIDPDTTDGDRAPGQIVLSVDIEGSIPAVQQLIYAMETDTPFLFVKKCQINAASQVGSGKLEAHLVVLAFRAVGS